MPSPATLKKYGITQEEFSSLLEQQGGVCPICQKVPTTGRWVIDHEHVRGWKKMPPEQRKLYVRGILCWFCNRNYLARTMTREKAKRIDWYLGGYEEQVKWRRWQEDYEKNKTPT